MKNILVCGLVLLLSVFSVVMANSANSGDEVSISISPSVLSLKSKVTDLTVHSNIPYASVVTSTVALDGMEADMVKADDLGALVARFDITELKKTLSRGTVTMTLTVETIDGDIISASDTISVR